MRLAVLALALCSLVTACSDDGVASPGAPDAGAMMAADATTPPVADSSSPTDAASPLPASPDAAADATVDPGWEVQDLAAFDVPELLSQAGPYADVASETLAEGVRAYRPLGQLWSDGAVKRRYLYLPPGATIDTRDMDQWVFPVGTRLFKEFSRDGVRLETRLIEKLDADTWRMVAYQWNPELTDARAVPLGVVDAAGTDHDIPDTEACEQCHRGRADKVLGATALQLSHDMEGLTLASLVAEGVLSDPPTTLPSLPGDGAARAALAYLHANCGHCHNPTTPRAEREISVHFWQPVDRLASLEDTVTYQSLVTDKSLPLWIDAVARRMGNRGGIEQMPPLATEHVDAEGMALVAPLMAQLRAAFPADALEPTGTPGPCPDIEPVFDIFETAACRNAFCHGAGTGELDFRTPEELHDSLVGVAAVGEGCDDIGLSRVEPGDPQRSLLMIKLRAGPPCGKIMPPAMSLTPEEIRAVEDWIAACQ